MRLSVSQIRNALLTSMSEANEHYSKMTGGEWITERGVESFLAYYVSNAFKNLMGSDGYVTVEMSMKELRNALENKKDSHFKSGERIDVVVTDNSHKPFGVVELKRDEFVGNWEKDADRILAIMRDFSEIEFGAFAVFMSEGRDEAWLDEKLQDIRDHVKERKKGAIGSVVFTHFEKTSSWIDGAWNGESWSGRYSVAGVILSRPA
jgi:hypothetical protein